MVGSVWLRRHESFAEEARADREFWASMTPDQRVAVIDQLIIDWLRLRGAGHEGLRRSARVLEPSRR
jgi:hypothetical protein